MDPIGLNWQALMSSWIDHWPNTSPITTFVKSLCNYLLPPCLQMALKYLQSPMFQTRLLLNFFKLVDAMLNVACICYKTIGCASKKFHLFPNVHHDITTNMENDLLINLADLSKTNMRSKYLGSQHFKHFRITRIGKGCKICNQLETFTHPKECTM